jgi:hypothetical protein
MTDLADLYHYFGTDLTASAGGDLATATVLVRSQQRIVRRLLTNPGDYKWHPNYGAGLQQWIGRTADIPALTALVTGQVLLEPSVSRSSAPVVTISHIANADGGGFAIQIAYTYATTGQPTVLAFNVTN